METCGSPKSSFAGTCSLQDYPNGFYQTSQEMNFSLVLDQMLFWNCLQVIEATARKERREKLRKQQKAPHIK